MERGRLDSTGKWRWSYAKCSKCNRTHEDWMQLSLMTPEEQRGERQARSICDPCLRSQVGASAFNRYKEHMRKVQP